MSSQHNEAAGAESAWARVDTSVAHPARRYDYLLGGKDNFAADRESGDRLIAAIPAVRVGVLENRAFMRRAVSYLTGQAGIRQFLDIGTGIPTSPNLHEIAQGITPSARVVYVDNDPIVLAHARALLTSSRDGATAYVDADLRRPDDILTDPDLLDTIDLAKPVALSLIAVLHFIPDSEDAHGLVARLVRALAPGSFLVMSHGTYDFLPPPSVGRLDRVVGGEGIYPRPKDEFARFFAGLELVDPGIVSTAGWRSADEPGPRPTDFEVGCWSAVARIP